MTTKRDLILERFDLAPYLPQETKAKVAGDGQQYAETPSDSWPLHSAVGGLHPGDRVLVYPPVSPDGHCLAVERIR